MNNDEKSISINEYLSAMLDDETGMFEQRRVLDELKVDQALTNKLSNYALIGETMRLTESENAVPVANKNFLTGIHEKITKEDKFDQVVVASNSEFTQDTRSPASLSWLRPVGGFAIAASLGALALMGLQNMGLLTNPTAPSDEFVNSSAPTAIVEVAPTSNSISNEEKLSSAKQTIEATQSETSKGLDEVYVDANLHTRSMLKRYVDSHMQYASTSTFVPSVRVIAYTDNQ